jgi:hypothetical protein
MKTIILLAVLITAIHLLCTKETFAQSQSHNTSKYYEISGDSLVKYTIKDTRFFKKPLEIHIIYNKIENKIAAVEKNGIKIHPDEYSGYQHYIQDIEEERQQIKSDIEEMHLQLRKDQMQLEADQINLKASLEEMDLQIRKDQSDLQNNQLLLKKVLQITSEELTLKGYQIKDKPFKMQLKNFRGSDLNGKIYLDNKLLPEEITNDLMKIYTGIKGTVKINSTLHLNIPDGLNVEIQRIEMGNE